MVKRVPTPPLVNDTHIYSVFKPFPMYINCEDKAEVKLFCHWVASILGTSSTLLNVYHKPRAPGGIVLIELQRDQDDSGLLGEHKWSEMLNNPTDEEKGCVSQIFYCIHKSFQDTRKDGWKVFSVEEDLFNNWSPRNKRFAFPYPPTSRCEPPNVDNTTRSLCLNLPSAIIPPAPKTIPRLIPGSQQWSGIKEGKVISTKPQGVRAKGKPALKPTVTPKPFAPVVKNSAWGRPNAAIKTPVISAAPSHPPGIPVPRAYTNSPTISRKIIPGGAVNSHGNIPTRTPFDPPNPYELLHGEVDVDDEDPYIPFHEEAEEFTTYQEYTESTVETNTDLWNTPQTTTSSSSVFKCPIHAKCPRGICQEHAKWKRKQERAQKFGTENTGRKDNRKSGGKRNKKRANDSSHNSSGNANSRNSGDYSTPTNAQTTQSAKKEAWDGSVNLNGKGDSNEGSNIWSSETSDSGQHNDIGLGPDEDIWSL